MNSSTSIKSVLLAITGLFCATSVAQAIPTVNETINLCVGESHTIEAAPNAVFTYTNPKMAESSSEAISLEARRAEAQGWEMSDRLGTPLWTELRPNHLYLDNPIIKKKSLVSYVQGLRKKGESRVVIQARSEGVQNVEYYSVLMGKKAIQKHVAKVIVAQCGTSSAVNGQDNENWCQGELRYAPNGTQILAGAESMYEFKGAETTRRYFAAQRPGRVMMSHEALKGGVYREMNFVHSNGEGVCGYADEARLEALEGPNNYLLQVCSGDTWVAPTGQRIIGMKVSKGKNTKGMNNHVELSTEKDGLLVRSFGEGNAKITMSFEHPDASPATIYLESVECD